MGVHFEWDDDSKQILIMHIEAPWTWEEYRLLVNETFDQIAALNHPVATIADVSRLGQLPPGNFLGQLQYVESHMPKNVYASVLVGAPYIVTTFMNVLMKIRPNAKALAMFASSIDEAKALLQQRQQGKTV